MLVWPQGSCEARRTTHGYSWNRALQTSNSTVFLSFSLIKWGEISGFWANTHAQSGSRYFSFLCFHLFHPVELICPHRSTTNPILFLLIPTQNSHLNPLFSDHFMNSQFFAARPQKNQAAELGDGNNYSWNAWVNSLAVQLGRGWEHFLFSPIVGMIQSDELIFFRVKPPTR